MVVPISTYIRLCGHRQVLEAYYYSRITDEISNLSETRILVAILGKVFVQLLDGVLYCRVIIQ